MEIHPNHTYSCPYLADLRGFAAGGSWMRCAKSLAKRKNYFGVALRGNPKEAVEINIPTALRVEVQRS